MPRLVAALSLLIAVSIVSPTPAQAAKPKATGGAPKQAAIVVDAQTGEVLHAQNADSQTYPASLTKIMTLYLAFEALEKGKLKMDQPLAVSARASGMAPSKLGLRPGQTIRARDAIMGLVTKSANDAAVVVAEALGGSEPEFAQMMTTKARALGMGRTVFANASGLPNPHQVTTARDMAILARALQKNFPQYYQLFSTRDFEYGGLTHRNHNHLLGQYDGADGIKTGFINASGFNLVASAKRNGRRLIGVVFGGETARSRDIRMMHLLDNAFDIPSRGRGPDLMVAGVSVDDPETAASVPAKAAKKPAVKEVSTKVAEASVQPQSVQPLSKVAKEKAGTAKAAPKATESKVAEAGDWSIQVGAFSKESAAHAAAEKAMSKAKAVLDSVKVAVVRPSRRDPLYRARLVGLTEEKARKACQILQKQKMHCMPMLSIDGTNLAALKG